MSILGAAGEALGAVGETLTAMLVTKEAAGGDGSSGHGAEHPAACANCGTALNGHYCHSCGQSSHIHRSLLHMMEEFLHGIFHFDTKAWRTIPALIFKPGKLTKEYIQGKRTSFVSPLALFLFLNFLMFFVFSLTVDDKSKDILDVPQKREELVEKLEKAKATLLEQKAAEQKILVQKESTLEIHSDIFNSNNEIRDFQDKIDAIDGKVKVKSELQAQMAKLVEEQKNLKAKKAEIVSEDESKFSEEDKLAIEIVDSDIRYYKREIAKLDKASKKEQLKKEIKDQVKGTVSPKTASKEGSSANDNVFAVSLDKDKSKEKSSDIPADGTDFNFNLDSDSKELDEVPYIGKYLSHASKNPELTLYKAKKNASSLAFLLVPLSLPFLWLLFAFRRQFVMFDHAVFSLYSLSFMFILMMAVAIFAKFHFKGTAAMLFTFVPPIHMYLQLRDAYGLKRFGAFWRTCALLLIAFTSLMFYFLIVIGAASVGT